jgi:hypothetical protein
MLPLPLKLLLTASLIAAATLAARRWGPVIGGWLVGLPLTSGPVSVFLALEQGRDFAARAALASLTSLPALAAFNLAYARLAPRTRWYTSLLGALGAFFPLLALCRALPVPLLAALLLAVTSFALALAFLPGRSDAPSRTLAPPRWDLPLRMLIATLIVLALTEAARSLGPRWVGLLSPLPVFSTVLAAFTHEQLGGAAAVALLRGVLVACFGVAAFFALVALLLPSAGLAATYGAAVVGTLLLNAGSLWLVRARRG